MIDATCIRGDMAQLRLWGQRGVRVLSPEPLCVCVKRGLSLSVLRCLVKELGADINQRDKDGWTPATIAAHFGYLETIRCISGSSAQMSNDQTNMEIGSAGPHGCYALHGHDFRC
jgi:ankyrin repeat protein